MLRFWPWRTIGCVSCTAWLCTLVLSLLACGIPVDYKGGWIYLDRDKSSFVYVRQWTGAFGVRDFRAMVESTLLPSDGDVIMFDIASSSAQAQSLRAFTMLRTRPNAMSLRFVQSGWPVAFVQGYQIYDTDGAVIESNGLVQRGSLVFATLPTAWGVNLLAMYLLLCTLGVYLLRLTRRARLRCFKCSYNISDLLDGVCPECGTRNATQHRLEW